MQSLRRWWRGLGLGSRSSKAAASRVLVSVYVQPKAMPSRRLFLASRRILLTTSIWTFIVLIAIVFVTYTVLLVSVDHPFQRAAAAGRTELVNSAPLDVHRPRLRLQGRGVGARNSSALASALSFSSSERRRFWDLSQLDDAAVEMPECRRGSLFTVLITSTPHHFEHRAKIRRTWCNPALPTQDVVRWQCVFLVGRTNDTQVATRLRAEGRRHGDLLRGSYLDSYRNLTLKVMQGLRWVDTSCQTLYVLKTDDDCFANTVLLQQFLLTHNAHSAQLYAGSMVVRKEKRQVIRKPNEKWSVSLDDYLPDYYPMYASGSGYVLSFDVVRRAVEESPFVKPIPNEDAYLGILMDRLGVPPKLSGRFTLSSNGLRVCNFLYVFVAHGVAPSLHEELCRKMLAAQTDCRSKEDSSDW
ncbi:beta-1,3-galactosyltransferase 5-like [Babylonia areolata]|uniref:beta-1,3-galactosyltransferase 5-like n=1 Tax=Babylonia areolata TaxID=304850 RepID=UPI003FD03EAA